MSMLGGTRSSPSTRRSLGSFSPRREADPCCFILTRNGTKLIVVIYVDDFGIFHS